MKQLFLIRHAKSSWSDESLSDKDRPLKPRGKRQVTAMAGPMIDLGALEGPVYVSDATRARQTAEGLAASLTDQARRQRFRYRDDLYTFKAKALRHWLKAADDNEKNITLIGHNPALLKLANQLSQDTIEQLPTAGMLHIVMPIKSWKKLGKRKGTLKTRLFPSEVSYPLFKRKAPTTPSTDESPLTRRIPLMLAHHYRLIRLLEPGVLAGYDAEFLHQYRVNLRRSRAMAEPLVVISGNSGLKKAVKGLKRHGQATGRLRDLDVFLETLAHWQQQPEFAEPLQQAGASTFFRGWAQEEHDRLSRQIRGRRYQGDMEKWQRCIGSEEFKALLAQVSSDEVRDVLHQRIAGHDHLLASLSLKSADGEVHELRKRVKRIRYLAEMDNAEFRDTLTQLKQRQELLGHYQDLCVQLELLDRLVATVSPLEAQEGLRSLEATLVQEKQALLRDILRLGSIG